MNISTIMALLGMVMALLGKTTSTSTQAQAISMANQVIVMAEQWIDENATSATPVVTTYECTLNGETVSLDYPCPAEPSTTMPVAPAPTASITANGSANSITIPDNTPVTISWNSTNASYCRISPSGWTGASGNITTGNLSAGPGGISPTFSLYCTGSGGSTSASVTVNVTGSTSATTTTVGTIPVITRTMVTATNIAPSSGPTTGGTDVTITGTGFASNATVTIGGYLATVTSVSADGTTISAITPAGAAGVANVMVANPVGTPATLANGFTYVAPVVPPVALTTPTVETINIGGSGENSSGLTQGINVTVGNVERSRTNNINPTMTGVSFAKQVEQEFQDSGLGWWTISAPDNTTLTAIKITVDPNIQNEASGLTLYVGNEPWTSANGTTWTGSATIGTMSTTISVSANLESVAANFLNGYAVPSFTSAVSITGLTGTDLTTGATINQQE